MKSFYILFSLFVFCVSCDDKQQQAPIDLLCEYLVNPISIDNTTPRFRWKMPNKGNDISQESYRVIVGTDSAAVAKGEGDMWDTNKVMSDAMLVTYQGKTLQPLSKYYWTVKLSNNDFVESNYAKVNSFQTGFLGNSNWQGSFISDTDDVDLKPAPYFRKVFKPKGKVKKAMAYVTAAGLFEFSINGKKVGDHVLDPMYTRFDKRVLYVAHDVTAQLQEEVALGILLGNGWYNHQSTAVWDFHKAHWRARPKFCLNLFVTYEDGSQEVISTDKSWKTSLGPIIFNSIYTAEHYDARLEQKGWDTPKFNDQSWKSAIEVENPAEKLVAQALQPIRITDQIKPVEFNQFSNQNYVYDLGMNISGVSQIKVEGAKGTVVRVTHAELLGDEGHVDQSNIDVHYRPTDDSDPFQTDIYILKGAGVETFMPKFNYKGFQYVEVNSDKPITLSKESLIGMRMHSDVPVVGNVHSSDSLLNKMWAATNNSYLSNLFGYPTDCPQREKNGWTGDAHIASETGLFNFDGITIYEKWLADHRDEQQPNGVLPSIIPTHAWGYDWGNGPDWTSTIAIIPWNIYLFYGDTTLLSDSYASLKLYVDHIAEIDSAGLTDWGLGDWIPVADKTPKEFTSSIYYYVDASILAKSAKLFGKTADNQKYANLADSIKNAINNKYLDKETGIYGSGFQTEQSTALFWGIVPDDMKAKVAANLEKKVRADNSHLNVGLLGTKAILNALSENGYSDLAYEVALQDSYPSWGWWIKNGATSLFENWPIDAKSDISRNHIMFGEIGAWFYKALGGINPDPEKPGFKNVILNPHFVEGLDQFEAKHQGPYGEIVSSWKKEGEVVKYSVVIPANSTATINIKSDHITKDDKHMASISKINGDYIINVKSGTHSFTVQI
ncbi:alpha-L-rhamnosidase [Chondrinema litorale]|uniref:alpha-L-rhamnosidase n=1 Tax=Chondrinema litorale TaxID=2994555 RepID=UPI002542E4E0|nr:alpha-L-rhamnosidase [Chondrinema litorale]UZR99746.1 family 78 glycoside hydrolase catalytic domain [Chondrinema litorale]